MLRLLFLVFSTFACSNPSSDAMATLSSADLYQSSLSAGFQAEFVTAGKASFTDLHASAIREATDAPVSVDGTIVSGLATKLASETSEAAAMDHQYGTLQSFWEAFDVDPKALTEASLASAEQTALTWALSPHPNTSLALANPDAPFECEARGYQKAMTECATYMGVAFVKMSLEYYFRGVQSPSSRAEGQLGANCVFTLNKYCPGVVPDKIKPGKSNSPAAAS